MKRLAVFLALFAYAFSINCDTCEADCKKKFGGLLQRGKYLDCLDNCIEKC